MGAVGGMQADECPWGRGPGVARSSQEPACRNRGERWGLRMWKNTNTWPPTGSQDGEAGSLLPDREAPLVTWVVGSGQCHLAPRQPGCQTLVCLWLQGPGWLPMPGGWPVEVAPGEAMQTCLHFPLCSGLPGARGDTAPDTEAGPGERMLALLPELAGTGHGGKVASACVS